MIKPLEENTGLNLHGFGLGKAFWGTIPKAQATKEKTDKLNNIERKKNFGVANNTVEKSETQPTTSSSNWKPQTGL